MSVDFTACIGVLPHRDDRVTAREIRKGLGGPAANVAVAASSLGAPWEIDAELLTVIGDDPDSDWALAELARRGVSSAALRRRPGQRLSRCVILVENNGSRTIVNEPLALDPDEVRRFLARPIDAAPHRAHWVHVEGFQVPNLIGVLPQDAKGPRLSMHAPGLPDTWRNPDGFSRLRSHFDAIFLNRETARDMTGFGHLRNGQEEELVARLNDLCRACPGRGAGALVVLTLGPAGAAVLRADGRPARVAAAPARVVDTTGAGDAFTGIFLATWLNGAAPADAARLAAHGASLSVEAYGAQGRVLSAADLTHADAPARHQRLEA